MIYEKLYNMFVDLPEELGKLQIQVLTSFHNPQRDAPLEGRQILNQFLLQSCGISGNPAVLYIGLPVNMGIKTLIPLNSLVS